MISICVPIYNTERYLKRCIDSLINQSYKDLEIVLVDDGSTDKSGKICDEAKNKDKRIKVVHKKNGGEASARNAGLEVATGEYVCFIDSDDEYYKNAIEELYNSMQKEKEDLAVGGYLVTSSKETLLAVAHSLKYSKKDIASAILYDKGTYGDAYIFSTVNAKLFKLSTIKNNNIRFDEKLVVGNDSLFICNYLKHITGAVNTLCPIYRYYKYDVEERLQGMGWNYPDAYILEVMVRGTMAKYAEMEDLKRNNLIVVDYMKLIKNLCRLVGYEEGLSFDIKSYIDYCRKKVPCFEEGALLEVRESIIADKNKYNIPYSVVSYMITEGQDLELINLLRILNITNKENNSMECARLMIKVTANEE